MIFLQILEGWKYDDLIIMNFYPIHSFSEYCSDEYDLILEENSEKDILFDFFHHHHHLCRMVIQQMYLNH